MFSFSHFSDSTLAVLIYIFSLYIPYFATPPPPPPPPKHSIPY